MANKWNYKTHTYDDYDLPDGASEYSADLTQTVNCASCGKPVVALKTYTSLEIHTDMGLGYMVCKSCYEKELDRRQKDVK